MAVANFGSSGIAIEKLTENNYENWKACLTNYFISKGLWDVVTGKDEKPTNETSPKFQAWERKNAKALHAILVSCERETMSKHRIDQSAKDDWDRLANKVQDSAKRNRIRFVSRENAFKYRPVYNAVEKGNWREIQSFLRGQPSAMRERITMIGDTVIHVAVIGNQTKILKKLLAESEVEDLREKNYMGYTAFAIAAINGSKAMVEAMMEKDANLIEVRDGQGLLPVVSASIYSSVAMVRHLYAKTPIEMLSPDHNTDGINNGATLLNCLINDEIYDLALQLLEIYPLLCFKEDYYKNVTLRLLSQKTSAFPSGNKYGFWKQLLYSCISVKLDMRNYGDDASDQQSSDEESINWCHAKQIRKNIFGQLNLFWIFVRWLVPGIYAKRLKHVEAHKIVQIIFMNIPRATDQELQNVVWNEAISEAIENGLSELIDEIINFIPEMIWRLDEKGRTIFAKAILQRQEKIFSNIYRLDGKMRMAVIEHDIFGNNYLHLAAKLSPQSRLDRFSGAALQMQREYEWFQEVQNIVPSRFREETNENNKKPIELFRDEHHELLKEGERWMKNTAASCMVVATLIAAVMFTSAFTVPGGNNQETGLPILLKHNMFLVFVISNALSLFSSSTSIIIFLGILTSRYAEKDFHKLLPTRLIVGLFALFFSIITMMVAFGAAVFLTLQGRLSLVSIPLIALSSIPVTLFAISEFPLLIETIIHTYVGNIFNKPKKYQGKRVKY